MKSVISCALGFAICLWHGGPCQAGSVLTFEGLKNFEPVADYYDGGLGGFDSGPGPAYGITFSTNALAQIRTSAFPNDPSPPTTLLLGNFGLGAGQPISMTMDVAGGFTDGISFYDIAIGRQATVQIYSGVDGGGTLLATENLPLLPPSAEIFNTSPVIMEFAGTAKSVVFSGGNLQLVLDNIAFLPMVPEPSSWIALGLGLGGLLLARQRTRRKTQDDR
jgi:hypothetical protein